MKTVTLAQALHIVADISNGTIAGTSASKGGRVWLEGEFLLSELEALCIVLRHEAGDTAAELIDIQGSQ
jgi:hypothetical protein